MGNTNANTASAVARASLPPASRDAREVAMAATCATVAIVAAPFVLSAAGFTPVGIAANSLAAWYMSISGPIASGSVFAALQSAGASGLGPSGMGLAAAAGAHVTAVAAEKKQNGRKDFQNFAKVPLDYDYIVA